MENSCHTILIFLTVMDRVIGYVPEGRSDGTK